MNIGNSLMVLMCSSIFSQSVNASQEEVVWSGMPIEVSVKPDTERLLIFPYAVDLEIPVSISQKAEFTITRPGYVLISPRVSFNAELIRVRKIENGSVILLRLASRPDGDTKTLHIVDSLEPAVQSRQTTSVEDSRRLSAPPEIILARFATQTLYAPSRLIPGSSAIHRLGDPIPKNQHLRLLTGVNGETFEYYGRGAWFGYGLYITAIEVRNLGKTTVELDPRQIRQGAFKGAFFQHQYVTAKDTWEDRTTMYLISGQPFIDALRGYRYVAH